MQGWRSGNGMPLLTLSPEFTSRKRCHVRGLVRISPKVRTVFQISLRRLIGLSALNVSTPGSGLTLTFSSYPWRLTKIAFTRENFHNIRVFPLKNVSRLPVKNMGLPLKNFVATQLGGGGGGAAVIKCNTPFGAFLYPQDPSHLRGRFWVVKQLPARLSVVGRNVAWGHEKRLGSRRRQSGPCRILTGFLAFYLFVFFLRGVE